MAQLMFPAIVHRGPHAFGWMSFNPATGITVAKHKGKVTHKRNLSKVDIDPDCSWFVGHVRWATNGTPDYPGNNHPLTHGSIVGVHNGVLRDWEPILAETGREDDKAEVDSEAIFAAVHKWGIKDGLKRIEGNMVAVFAQTSHPEVLNIARTVGRPLVYATTAAGSLIFASECCVIDACGYEFSNGDYTDFTGQYRHITVAAGKVTSRAQFRTPPPRKPITTPAFRTSTAYERGEGVSGITDFFASQQGKGPTRRRSSLDHPTAPARPQRGTAPGTKDESGGEYMGAGWYRTPDGQIMPVDRYVEWSVNNARAKWEDEAKMDSSYEYLADAEAQAEAIILGNDREG
jgi:asparagine synthetase B (glutamine-hydrolysing)